MSADWDYNTWRTADLKSLLAEVKGILEERDNDRKKDITQQELDDGDN